MTDNSTSRVQFGKTQIPIKYENLSSFANSENRTSTGEMISLFGFSNPRQTETKKNEDSQFIEGTYSIGSGSSIAPANISKSLGWTNQFPELTVLTTEAKESLNKISKKDELPNWYHDYLGRKGKLPETIRLVGAQGSVYRREIGPPGNSYLDLLQHLFDIKQEEILAANTAAQMAAGGVDITLPGRPVGPGHLHLTTQTLRRIREIFGGMGFQVYEAPEVETDEYNFGLLNIPPYHPARDMWDTFWVSDSVVLRTHTSPGQIRCMRESVPHPIRVILPGKCYRYEQITPRSEHQFFQVEGLAVGHGIRITDLIGTMQEFANQMYGAGRTMRVRGSYFPFTEPSIEVDMDCIICQSKGCRMCKFTGWLEIAGAGMVHPVVLRNGGYDPAEWSGFAFGMGVERPSLLKHGIDDIRQFYANDLRFLRQF